MRALFIHRSVGQQIVDCGNLRSVDGIALDDLNVNGSVLTSFDGVSSVIPQVLPNGNTNPADLGEFFRLASSSGPQSELLQRYDVVAFKSCYSANNLRSDDELENAMRSYETDIADFIRMQPDKQFVIISPPPRKPPVFTHGAKSRRAADYAKRLSDLARQFPNAHFADVFGALADRGGGLRRKYRRQMPWDQHPNDRGAQAASDALVAIFRKLPARSNR